METYDPNKKTTEVRQGNKRQMNLRVLGFSLIAIVVIFAVIFGIYSMMAPPAT
jgi:t-SNARE complex subunit (syntaxin)